MGLKTPLYAAHVQANAKIIDFGGWDMPLHYGSQLEEHHAVRRDAGMFDVSHMGIVDLHGARVRESLRRLLANDVGKLTSPGKALYSCLLSESGGVLDDLIVYFMADGWFRIVVNAGPRDKDLAWIERYARDFGVAVHERRELCMIAVQGPHARAKSVPLLPAALRSAASALRGFTAVAAQNWCIARTGYTGEDGFEIMLPADAALLLWGALRGAAVTPAGLGARDTLRLEAGLNLYGSDMDESHDPLESGLAWTVAFEPAERDFIGRAALERARAQRRSHLVGLVLEERGVLRSHQRVFDTAAPAAAACGEITSGTFSPTLGRAIALARIPTTTTGSVYVDIRGKLQAARIVAPPFVRLGKSNIDL